MLAGVQRMLVLAFGDSFGLIFYIYEFFLCEKTRRVVPNVFLAQNVEPASSSSKKKILIFIFMLQMLIFC
jgi:hypothetical protein